MSDEVELRKLDLPSLQERLKSQGLPTVGDADQLVFRLLQAQVKGFKAPLAPPPPPPAVKVSRQRFGGKNASKGFAKGKGKMNVLSKEKGKGKAPTGQLGKGNIKRWTLATQLLAKGKGRSGKGQPSNGAKGLKIQASYLMKAAPKMRAVVRKQVLMQSRPKASAGAKASAKVAATSKSPSMLGASAKAPALGATARRFVANLIFSKAAAVAKSFAKSFAKSSAKSFAKSSSKAAGDVAIFGGKAFTIPPWRRPQVKAPKKDEEPEYDPFTEEPAPHVQMEKVIRKATRRAAAAGLEVVSEWKPKGPPARRKAVVASRKALEAVPQVKAAAIAAPPKAPETAASWLKRGSGVSFRMRAGAALAEEHFGEAPAKKPRTEPEAPLRGFAAELLEKTPSTLQTCRSLLLFLDKKLEGQTPEAPAVGGPEELRAQLEAQADGAGRVASVRQTSGWDARAKRVLDITATAKSAAGEAALKALQEHLDASAKELESKLKELGQTVEALTKERQAWAQEGLRRSWLSWCAKLLRAREAKLLLEIEKADEDEPEEPGMTAIEILEALLSGSKI